MGTFSIKATIEVTSGNIVWGYYSATCSQRSSLTLVSLEIVFSLDTHAYYKGSASYGSHVSIKDTVKVIGTGVI